MRIKRIDRTKQLMVDLEKSATRGVKEAAIMLKVIAREMVSRKYTKKPRRQKTAMELAIQREDRRRQARQYFVSRPPKAKRNTQPASTAGG
jgi:hypothetical protein